MTMVEALIEKKKNSLLPSELTREQLLPWRALLTLLVMYKTTCDANERKRKTTVLIRRKYIMYTQMVCREALGKCGETEKPDDAALPAGRLNATAVLIRTGACGQEEEEEELLAVALCSGRDAVFGSHFLRGFILVV